MARQNVQLLSFNRGRISTSALARVDVERIGWRSDINYNWSLRTLGPMSLRPGLGFVGRTQSDAYATFIPFVYAVDDTALLEVTTLGLRAWVKDSLVTRPAVSSTVTNGTFDTDLTGWVNLDEGGATSAWGAGGYMSLQGNNFAAAIREREVSVTGADIGVEHAIHLHLQTGECYLKVGSTSGADDYVAETFLYPGHHSLAFTPTGNFFIRVLSREPYPTLIDSITIEQAGAMLIQTPWSTKQNLKDIRYDQSGDVVFVACKDVRPMRIERRGVSSWSVSDFVTDDGPFLPANTSVVTLTPAAITGHTTITASRSIFTPDTVGSLLKLTSVGVNISFIAGGANQWTDEVKVTGTGAARDLPLTITITDTATVELQRALGDTGDWFSVATYTTTTSTTYNDGLSGQVTHYRLVCTALTSGTATLAMTYQYGSKVGLFRVTGYTSSTVVTGNVLKAFGSTVSTDLWSEGSWSPARGYPSAVALYQGRLFWAGNDRLDGSVSDAYISYDEDYVGDAGPISRTIGTGPVEQLRWMHASSRLVLGGQMSEWEVRSSSLDEPLTPTNANIKRVSTRGSAAVNAVMVDHDILFADRSSQRVMLLVQDAQGGSDATDATLLVPEVTAAGVVGAAVQRVPDTKVHFVLADGTVAVLVYDRAENVKGWGGVVTQGAVEQVVVLPQESGEDAVYYIVNRTINGGTVRTLERFALAAECVGSTINKLADGFVVYTGAATTHITGLDHLEGEEVVCWADGADAGTFTVVGGAITLGAAATNAVVGLPYTARWRSAKLAYAAQEGSALTQPKRVDHLGLLLENTHAQGLRYGTDFDHMDELPLYENGAAVGANTIHATYDEMSIEVNGTIDTDSRLCLEASAPRPVTVMAAVLSMTTNERL